MTTELNTFGRMPVAGAQPTRYDSRLSGKHDRVDPDGTVIKRQGKRIVQLRHDPPVYLSADYLDDIDEGFRQPGWCYEWVGIEVEPTAEELEAERAEETRQEEERTEKAQREHAAVEARSAALAELRQIVSSLGLRETQHGYWLLRGNERWTTRFQDAHLTISETRTCKGTPIYLVVTIWGDEERANWCLPEDAAKWCLERWAEKCEITSEIATRWLDKYRGCVGTEDYEYLAKRNKD